MNFPEVIEAGKAILRQSTLGDAAEIFQEYAADPEVTRYLTWQPCVEVGEVTSYLEGQLENWSAGREFTWVITIAGSGKVIGMVTASHGPHGLGIGYVIGKRYWNQGYTTDALTGLCKRAWENPALFRIWATCDVENLGSARVLEKCGFAFEGILRRWVVHPNISNEPRDNYVYAVTR